MVALARNQPSSNLPVNQLAAGQRLHGRRDDERVIPRQGQIDSDDAEPASPEF